MDDVSRFGTELSTAFKELSDSSLANDQAILAVLQSLTARFLELEARVHLLEQILATNKVIS
jgi:hypothetical protein